MAVQKSRGDQTRAIILSALVDLLPQRRYDQIRIADIVECSGIGRSTLYENFANKDDMLLAAAEPILVPLASAATGRASKVAIIAMLDHVWASRVYARPLLRAKVAEKLGRALSARICDLLILVHGHDERHRVAANAASAAQFAILKQWVDGATHARQDVIANALMAIARATLPISSSH